MTSKMAFKKFPDYIPRNDDAYLDFTMKALDWQEDTKQKLKKHFQSKPKQRPPEPFLNEVLYSLELESWNEKSIKVLEELWESLK